MTDFTIETAPPVEIITAGLQGPPGPQGVPGVPDNTAINNLQTQLNTKAGTIEVQQALSGKADLVDGVIPAAQLPSYVDDVVEYANLSLFPENGEPGKVYIDKSSNFTYRWSGTMYVPIGGGGVALGETASTAYRGDRGKAAYDHSNLSGNPHNTTIAQISGLQGALESLQSQISNVGAPVWVDVLPPFLAEQPLLFTDPNGNNPLQVAKINGMIWIRGALTKVPNATISGFAHDLCFLPNTHKVYIPGNYARGPAVFYSSNDSALGFIKSWGVQPSYSVFDPTNQKITILESANTITQSAYNVCTFCGVLGLALNLG